MLSLDEVIASNARHALEAASKAAADKGETLRRADVVRHMARVMNKQAASVDRQLYFLLKDPPERSWRADYIEAFCSAVGVQPELLASPRYKALGRRS